MNESAHEQDPVLQRDLRLILTDGASYSVMVGIGEAYVPAFALALGLGEVAAGLIATLPMLTGGLLQLISPWAVRQLGSHRRWVVLCAVCQALSLLMMLGLALAVGIPPWFVFLPATLYWAAGQAAGPAWNAWVDRIVPVSIRPTFFARRTGISHTCVLVGIIAGGLILRVEPANSPAVSVFAVLFFVAAASRLLSAALLARQSEPADESSYIDQSGSSYRELFRRMRGGWGIQLIVYLLTVQVAVHLSAPFFTPFMLVQLKLSYTQYMVLLSCSFLGKILALPWAGRFARQVGAGRLLWVGGITIVPLSAMWLISNSIPYLICLQLVGGMAWAAFELAMLLLFFETIPREQRVTMLSVYNAGNATAIVIGATLGAALMHSFTDIRSAYLAVFGVSGVARLLALLLIPRHPPQLEGVEPPAGLRTIAVRPMEGGLERPILPGIPPTEPNEGPA
jgi:MFS family permease